MRRAKEWVKRNEEFLRKHRVAIVAALIAVFLLLAFFGAKTYLMVNFLLGNDIVVKLEGDKDVVEVVQGETGTVTFRASVITNPFCAATCEARLLDVSRGEVVERTNFTLATGTPMERSYELRAQRPGHGEELYQYTMSCRSTPTTLCRTGGDPTSRSVLVTLAYDLSDDEIARKQAAIEQAQALRARIGVVQGTLGGINATLPALSGMQAPPDALVLMAQAHGLEDRLRAVQEPWSQERYADALDALSALDIDIEELESRALDALDRTEAEVRARNALMLRLNATHGTLAQARAAPVLDPALAQRIDGAIEDFGRVVEVVRGSGALAYKEASVARIETAATRLAAEARESSLSGALRAALAGDLAHDALCALAQECEAHPALVQRVSAENATALEASCAYLETARGAATALEAARNASSPSPEEGTNASAIANTTLRTLADTYLSQLPSGTPSAQRVLVQSALSWVPTLPPVPGTLDPNSTPGTEGLLAGAVADALPAACAIVRANATLDPFSPEQVPLPSRSPASIDLEFPEPSPLCCVRGVCAACCEDCAHENYPVVFLHGHAFNEDTLADYSLDAFRGIEDRLEQDGYLNAGAISLYTPREGVPDGLWGHSDVPLLIGASYYFDLFKEPENYVIVQAKSESIDTYALRLREIIETIEQRTGKGKVVIVAHSMGGLVARRYIQVFGTDDVQALITVASPHQGIRGSTAQYCPLIGENLECRDMAQGSLFMNKLNRDPLPDIPVTVIVATGCRMDAEMGDGVLYEDSQRLSGADVVVIEGTCTTLAPLHTRILDVESYPEAYDAIKAALEDARSRETSASSAQPSS